MEEQEHKRNPEIPSKLSSAAKSSGNLIAGMETKFSNEPSIISQSSSYLNFDPMKRDFALTSPFNQIADAIKPKSSGSFLQEQNSRQH